MINILYKTILLLLFASGVLGELGGQGGESTHQGGDRGEEGGCRSWILPQVTNSEVGGRGGAAEEVGGGVGCPSVVRARGILNCPYPLLVGPKRGAETRTQLR